MRRLLPLLLAVATLSSLGAAGAQARAGAEYMGVNTQPLTKDTAVDPANWGMFYEQLLNGQMSVARLEVNWRNAEPVAPVNGVHTYAWNQGGWPSRTSTDYLVAALAAKGVRAEPLFAVAPAWVNGNGYRFTSAAYPHFAAFIAAFAQRYGPGGAFWAEHPELPALPTLAYEVWTEANSTNFWTGSPNAAEYAAAMKQIYPALKAAQPSARLLASIGWQDYSNYLQQFWGAGGGSAIDGIGFHPYAPTASAIIGLVKGLRAKLGALGAPGMAIEVTESGQPVARSGNGASSAGSGVVTDAARAATQTFAADVLARSDCGVGEFLVYAITGRDDGSFAGFEDSMGILRHADASPNETGQSLQRASIRWRAALASGREIPTINACGAADTPVASQVPLGLVLTRSGNTCVTGTASYDGNPLEGATIEFRATGRSYGQPTNAFGRNEVCLTNGPKVDKFQVFAQVEGQGRSAVYECDLPVTTCSVIEAAPSSAGTTSTTTSAVNGNVVSECNWQLRAGAWLKGKPEQRRLVTVTTRLQCAGPGKAAGRKVTFRVLLQRAGSLRELRLRNVTMRAQRKTVFRLRTKVQPGDLLVLLHPKGTKKSDPLPFVRTVVELSPALATRPPGGVR